MVWGDVCALSAGQHLPPTEWQPSDTYLLVAAHLMLEEACEAEKGWGLLWAVALELEEGRKNSPSNHQITLLLFRVYAELGEGRAHLGCMRNSVRDGHSWGGVHRGHAGLCCVH